MGRYTLHSAEGVQAIEDVLSQTPEIYPMDGRGSAANHLGKPRHRVERPCQHPGCSLQPVLQYCGTTWKMRRGQCQHSGLIWEFSDQDTAGSYRCFKRARSITQPCICFMRFFALRCLPLGPQLQDKYAVLTERYAMQACRLRLGAQTVLAAAATAWP